MISHFRMPKLAVTGLVGAYLSASAGFCGPDDTPPSGANVRIEDLLSRPLNISECIAKVCKFRDNSNRCYFVLMRWQPNAFFYREMPTLNDLETDRTVKDYELFGKYEDNYFRLEPTGLTNYFQSTTNANERLRPGIERIFTIQSSSIYNFGIFDTPPGRIKVSAGVLEPFTIATGLSASGRFIYRDIGKPAGLEFSVTLEGRQIPWEVEYHYDASKDQYLPTGIPSRITASVSVGERPVTQYDIELFSFVLSKTNLPQTFFSNDKYVKAGIAEIRFVGTNSFLLGAQTPNRARPTRIFVLAAFAIISFPLFVLIMRKNRSEQGE